MQMFIEEKELTLRQGLCSRLPVGCYMTSDNNIKMLDPALQSLKSLNQSVTKTKLPADKIGQK